MPFSRSRRVLALTVLPVVLPLLILGLTAGASSGVGPKWPHTTVLNGQFTFIPLKDAAMITRTRHGYVYRAGQQDSRLFVTKARGGVRFHDKGTRKFRSIPRACRRVKVRAGIAAVCRVPARTSRRSPMLLEIWPRLGDDLVDGSTMPAKFQMSVLADAGRDIVRLGAGDDFVNGAMGNDLVRGGAGDDWIRTGPDHDLLIGGPGDDKLVGSDGRDVLRGGRGADWLGGGNGADRLYSRDAGRDVVSCGGGFDRGRADRADRLSGCERLPRR